MVVAIMVGVASAAVVVAVSSASSGSPTNEIAQSTRRHAFLSHF